MEVEEVILENYDEEWFSAHEAIVSQISRQQTEVKTLKIETIDESSDSESFLSALRKCSSWSIDMVALNIEIGHEDEVWGKWAEISPKGDIGYLLVDSGLDLGRPELVRKVWLATKEISIDVEWRMSENVVHVRKEEGENGWARILQIITDQDQMETRK